MSRRGLRIFCLTNAGEKMPDDFNEIDERIEYAPIDESETDSCRALWVSVMVQAVVDARSKRSKPEYKRAKQEAIEWLEAAEGEQSELAETCALADLEFESTRKKLLELATDESDGVDFRCLRKAIMGNHQNELRSKYLARMRRREKAKALKTAG